MNNQLKQTPTQDAFDHVFQALERELIRLGVEYVEIHPEKVVFPMMGRYFKLEVKEVKKP